MPPPLHRSFLLSGPAGRMETILWSVAPESRASQPPFAAVVCHPHPLFGGTMHNKVVYQAAKTIHRLGLPVVRFNFRGVGLSEGRHDNGEGEMEDVHTVLNFLGEEFPNLPLLVAGFSFGAWVGLRAGCSDSRVTELIGLGLPVANFKTRSFSYLDGCEKPKLLVTGEFDQFGPPHDLRTMVNSFPSYVVEQTQIVIIGGDHFFSGHLPELDKTITAWLLGRHPELAAMKPKE